MDLCSLNLIFLVAGEHIAFGGAVDRAAVERAVDLAASLIFWGPRAKGPGPGTRLAPRGPRVPTLNLMSLCSLNLIFFTDEECITFGGAVDRAAVDQANDLAASLTFWGPGAKGPGPGTRLAPRDPGAPP